MSRDFLPLGTRDKLITLVLNIIFIALTCDERESRAHHFMLLHDLNVRILQVCTLIYIFSTKVTIMDKIIRDLQDCNVQHEKVCFRRHTAVTQCRYSCGVYARSRKYPTLHLNILVKSEQHSKLCFKGRKGK